MLRREKQLCFFSPFSVAHSLLTIILELRQNEKEKRSCLVARPGISSVHDDDDDHHANWDHDEALFAGSKGDFLFIDISSTTERDHAPLTPVLNLPVQTTRLDAEKVNDARSGLKESILRGNILSLMMLSKTISARFLEREQTLMSVSKVSSSSHQCTFPYELLNGRRRRRRRLPMEDTPRRTHSL